MSRTVVSLRLSAPELRFIDQAAADKGLTRAAALHQIFLQQVALSEIEQSVARLIDSRLSGVLAELSEIRQSMDQKATRDDLVKATNFLTKELKK